MKQLAIMKDVGVGVRDVGRACMFFNVFLDECTAALQVLDWTQAQKLINDSGIYDIKSLEGKPCWVERNDGLIHFISVAKI